MTTIHKVAIFGVTALIKAKFDVTVITRPESTATFPLGIRVIRAAYTVDELTQALKGQDAAICVVGPSGIVHQADMVDAAEAAGVKRFIINDFGWGPNIRGLPEFSDIHKRRKAEWEHAEEKARLNPAFTYTGITTGNPIDWALTRFPLMGFDAKARTAVIYDAGTEQFTGTTLQGIGQSVVGVLMHPDETANRFVKVQSLKTCQNELLDAFQAATGKSWKIHPSLTEALKARGRKKFRSGSGNWVLDLVIAQLFDEGEARCVVAESRDETDSDLLGVVEETPQQVVAKVLRSTR